VKVMVTGATGFVGSALLEQLAVERRQTMAMSRKAVAGCETAIIADITGSTDYGDCFKDIGCLIHTAARVHVMDEGSDDPLADYRESNTFGTLNMARQAAIAGVQRFIFVSSIKVSGEGRAIGQPYHSDHPPNPSDPYGISKFEAEQGLMEIALETGMAVVVIRPPLIYGPGVKANFLSMMTWLSRPVPLPFGAINNKRSLVAMDNLVNLIITCISHPNAANQTFLVSDDRDVSTTELLTLMTNALGKKNWLVPFPMAPIKLAAGLLGKSAFVERLCGSLQVDISHTKATLNWSPPCTMEQQLATTATAFKLGKMG
jgi:nucleoside-diphosphate-sugar epimerase